MQYILTITLIFIALVALVYFVVNAKMKSKARACAKEALIFHEKLQQLSDLSHFFTDEEAVKLKREFAPLVREVNDLYKNIFISNGYLDDIGLRDFLDERKIINHKQFVNNRDYKKD